MIELSCPLLKNCNAVSGIDCTERNFDGKHPHRSLRWQGREPCNYYKTVIEEKRNKLKIKVKHEPIFSEKRWFNL